MAYQYLKALHLIFIVTWFAGLFYVVRLFIYQTESQNKSEPERSVLTKEYQRISKLLWYGITWPSAILTLIFGASLAHAWWGQEWLFIKLGFVVLLYAYHWICHQKFRNLQQGLYKNSGFYLRVFNEVATILLVAIVFIVVLKNVLSLVWGLTGLVMFTVVLLLAIRIYKKIRERNEKNL